MKLMNTLLLIFLISCASYQKGSDAYIVKGEHPKGTPITAYVDHGYSTKHFTMVQLSFGNKNSKWTRIKKAQLDFNDKELNKKIRFVLGDDINTWAESIGHKRAVDAHNRAVLLGSLALAGAATTAAGSNSDTKLAGAAVYAGSLGAAGFNSFMNKMNELNRAKLIPAGHLYETFSIPPGLVTKRWILLEGDWDIIPNHIYLNITYENKKTVRYKVRIRDISNS